MKELKDTQQLMCSEDYKDRFKAEYYQTKIRYEKLHKILTKIIAGTLDFEISSSQDILEDQAYYMGSYLKTLEIRAEMEGIIL